MSSNSTADDIENGIIPLEKYNAMEGKLAASVNWLIAIAYKANIPDSLMNPCFRDNNKSLHLKPGTIQSLVSAELYRLALAAINDNRASVSTDLSHGDILRILEEFYSVPVYDENGQPLNERLLSLANPFNLNAHLAVIDALMIAYVKSSITIDRVVNCLKKYTNVHPNEIPNDDEDGLSFWINKICFCVRENLNKTMNKNPELVPLIPEMDDLYEDIYDGICLVTVLSFYAPDKLNINDVSFNDPVSVDDCLHNLRLIKTFCQRMSWNVFHFSFEDILYLHEILQQSCAEGAEIVSLQPNVGAFVTDLFNLLEPSKQNQSHTGATFSKRKTTAVTDTDQRLQIDRSLKMENMHPKSITSASRIKPTDILATDKPKFNKESPQLTLNLSNAMDGSQMRKSPTTTFSALSPNRERELINSSSYQRSDSLPINKLQAATNNGSKNTSWSIRMNLDEKRRQIENQQIKEKTEKVKLINDMNKEVFLTLYGKKPNSSSVGKSPTSAVSTTNGAGRTGGAAAKLLRPQSAKMDNKPPPVASSEMSKSGKSLKEYDEISKSISEIKEQMKRLSVEQEKLQNLVVPSPGANPQEQEQRSQPFRLHGSVSNVSAGSNYVQHPPSQFESANSFHLHGDNEPPSRLDPSLELSKNLSNWGMTYRVNKTPRKTWDNQAQVINSPVYQQPQQMNFENNNDLSFPVNTRLTPGHQQTSSGSNFAMPSNHFVQQQQQNNAPGHSPSGHYGPVGLTPEMLNYKVLAVKPRYNERSKIDVPVNTNFDVPAEPGVFSVQNYANKNDMSPLYVRTQQSPSQNSPTSSSKSPLLPMSPLPGSKFADNNEIERKMSANSVEKFKESSPGVGFVIGDDERRKEDEVNRKKEQVMAAALRRKAELDVKRARLDAENFRKQEELSKKQEEEEQKKKEKELHRLKVFEQYQKKKAEEASDSVPGTAQSTLKAGPRTARGHSQPPGRQVRPMSQMVTVKSVGLSNAGVGSVDNLDLIDGKSQSSDGTGSATCVPEPSLKLFVKPSQKSNRTIVYNAIQYSVLAGAANNDKKNKVLEELAKSDSKHFLILFRDQKCQFRGLYSWDQVSDTVHKLYGVGPKSYPEKSMKLLFKYDSGAKQFGQIPARHLSATIDGFTINDEFWQEKKPLYSKSVSMSK